MKTLRQLIENTVINLTGRNGLNYIIKENDESILKIYITRSRKKYNHPLMVITVRGNNEMDIDYKLKQLDFIALRLKEIHNRFCCGKEQPVLGLIHDFLGDHRLNFITNLIYSLFIRADDYDIIKYRTLKTVGLRLKVDGKNVLFQVKYDDEYPVTVTVTEGDGEDSRRIAHYRLDDEIYYPKIFATRNKSDIKELDNIITSNSHYLESIVNDGKNKVELYDNALVRLACEYFTQEDSKQQMNPLRNITYQHGYDVHVEDGCITVKPVVEAYPEITIPVPLKTLKSIKGFKGKDELIQLPKWLKEDIKYLMKCRKEYE